MKYANRHLSSAEVNEILDRLERESVQRHAEAMRRADEYDAIIDRLEAEEQQRLRYGCLRIVKSVYRDERDNKTNNSNKKNS